MEYSRIIKKMLHSQKYVFLNALILVIFIFAAGILLGYWMESFRVEKINSLYAQTDLNLLDIKALSDSVSPADCTNAIQANSEFGDRIYEEAKLLDQYEKAQRISEGIQIQHYKYDLLRILFLQNSLKLKKECNAKFHVITYFYDYINPDLDTKAKQTVISDMLLELKKTEGSNVILIPIAGDIDFSSATYLVKTYNITKLPTVLIDEKIKVEDIQSYQDIQKLLN